MKKLLKFIPAIALIITGLTTLAFNLPVYADSVCDSSSVSAEVKAAHGCSGYGSSTTLPDAVTSILSAIIVVCGLVSVAFIIVGGVKYITSSGDAGKAKEARTTILYACIGLIICALAFAIVNFVIKSIL